MQDNLTTFYKLTKKIKDDKFSIDLIPRYDLSLQVSTSLFRLCIVDTEENRCLIVEDYQLQGITDTSQLIKVLNEIYEDHHLLKAGFWKTIRLGIKNLNFSLVPHSLFDHEYLTDYLTINCKKDVLSKDHVYYYKQNSSDAVNIFSANKQIVKYFTEAYPLKKLHIVHHTSSLIEGILQGTKGDEKSEMFILVENNYITLLVRNQKKLEFCNCFNFTSTQDFVYFVMFVFEQLNLDPEKTKVFLYGEITPDSAIYIKLNSYICNLRFGSRPENLSFSYHFDELFDHRFFDLYNMHLCEQP
ncbi:DUF3822 family protein [Cytophagaceae bacterium ABcell3]|nr:DUF3822 family protein [Cytophagaceae bacterium ABcell3]